MALADAHVIHRKSLSLPSWLVSLGKIPTAVIADVHKRECIIDPGLHTFTPGVPLCGLVLTVRCGYGDNLMLHKALSMANEGDVIVVEMEKAIEADHVYALAGEVMVYAALQREAAGLVVDGLIRDSESIAETGFPVYARGACIRGPSKKKIGTINHEVYIGNLAVSPGDVIVGDADGLVCISAREAEEVLERAQNKLERETRWKAELASKRTTVDILELESILEQLGVNEEWEE